MKHERNARWWRAVNAAARAVLARKRVPLGGRNLIVNEFPKSGGTWLSQMLAAATGLPFPQHQLPGLRAQVLQGHYLRPAGMRNVVTLWRDGRDVLVSFYHHAVVGNEYSQQHSLRALRRRLAIDNPRDVRGNLARFAEYTLTQPDHPRFTWPRFAEVWAGRPGVASTTYEALRRDTAGELMRLVQERGYMPLSRERAEEIAAGYAFNRQRAGGQQAGLLARQFLRKGAVGDWRNHFTAETAQVFQHYAGATLIRLGYEADNTWADAVNFADAPTDTNPKAVA